MGLSVEDNIRRRHDERVNFIADNICRHDSGKPYVFISYKSDDWEIVLGEIVYKLVKDYGLNVYFDGDFGTHNSLWTKQFPLNMESGNCRGILAFLDDAYTTSYATLMELLFSQVGCSESYKHVRKKAVPINLSPLTQICDEKDTGLGVKIYEDGKLNTHADDEKELFDQLFQEASDLKVLKRTVRLYKREGKLTKGLCAAMCNEVLAYNKANENYYNAGCTLADIVGSIKDAFGDDVFSSNIRNGNSEAIIDNEKKEVLVVDKEKLIKEPIQEQKEIIESIIENQVKSEVNEKCEPASGEFSEIDENTTLEQFEKLCENIEFCMKLRTARKQKQGGTQIFDYLMASLLRGCDKTAFKGGGVSRKAAFNYCVYAIVENLDLENIQIGASQYTWTSNSRKAMRNEDIPKDFFNDKGKVKSGQLGEFSSIFEELKAETTIGSVLDKYRNLEKGFNTKNNDIIFESWKSIKAINCSVGKRGLEELL